MFGYGRTMACLLLYTSITLAVGTSVSALPQLSFPSLTDKNLVLPTPEPCEDGIQFCADDEDNYPSLKDIKDFTNAITVMVININNTLPPKFGSTGSKTFEDVSNIACKARIEKLPKLGRSINKYGKWKYILPTPSLYDNSDAEIVICKNEGGACINDDDSPHGTGSTVCRQVYRYERLLAIDEFGEVSIDNFPLPSACLCHHQEQDPFSLRKGFESSTRRNRPIISTRFSGSKDNCIEGDVLDLKGMEVGEESNNDDQVIFPGKVNLGNRDVYPCPNNSPFCSDLAAYPEDMIDKIMQNTAKISSETFQNLYSHPCQEQKKEMNAISLKQSHFDVSEEPLCSSKTIYAFPQKGINSKGEWRHIVNTKMFQQGISMEVCQRGTENQSCLYGGSEGMNPDATTCRQHYTMHPMFIVIAETGELSLEMFRIPSACVCHLLDTKYF